MTGLEQLREILAGEGQSPVAGLLDAAIALERQVGEIGVLTALVDMAAQAATLSGPAARCTVMESMADGGQMIAFAEQAIRAGHRVTLVPAWAGDAAGRA